MFVLEKYYLTVQCKLKRVTRGVLTLSHTWNLSLFKRQLSNQERLSALLTPPPLLPTTLSSFSPPTKKIQFFTNLYCLKHTVTYTSYLLNLINSSVSKNTGDDKP